MKMQRLQHPVLYIYIWNQGLTWNAAGCSAEATAGGDGRSKNLALFLA